MFADSSTRSGAESTGRAASGIAVVQLRLEQLRQRVGFLEVRRLREVPRHEFDFARAAADRRHALGRQGARRLRGAGLERRGVDRPAGERRAERRVGVQADEQIRLVVVGHRRPIVDRHAAVVVARQQHADAEARLDRGLDAAGERQRQVFLLRARRALHALVVAAVTRIDDDGADGTGRLRERAQIRGREARWRRRRRRRRAAGWRRRAWRGPARPRPPWPR